MNIKELNELSKSAKKTDELSELLLKLFGGVAVFCIGLPLLFVYVVWAHAYVVVHLWAWFIVPTFGLPQITMPVAWGMALLMGLCAHDYNPCKSKDERSTAERLATVFVVFIRPWMILGCGALALHYMK